MFLWEFLLIWKYILLFRVFCPLIILYVHMVSKIKIARCKIKILRKVNIARCKFRIMRGKKVKFEKTKN